MGVLLGNPALHSTSVRVDARALALLGVGSTVGAVLGARFGAKVGPQAMIVTLAVATVVPGALLALGEVRP